MYFRIYKDDPEYQTVHSYNKQPQHQHLKPIRPKPMAVMSSDLLNPRFHYLRVSKTHFGRAYMGFQTSILEFAAAVFLHQNFRQILVVAVSLAILGTRIIPPAFVWLPSAVLGICGWLGWFFFGQTSIRSQDFGRYRPRFFLCWTTHMRLRPFRCSFRYPILYVGFLASARGSISGGRMFSILSHKPDAKEKFTFFTVDPKRYYNGSLPFDQKLNDFLKSHGRGLAEFPYIYFVTTPAFFKVAFNPVSYYYLYNSAHELVATVLEVNNTFHQSYMYILNPSDIVPLRRGYTFSSRIQKDLHISPFNKPTGYYDMQVLDPLAEPTTVDINMCVFDDEGRKTMAARATSGGRKPWDMQAGSCRGAAWITVAWGVNSMIALPLTLFEAWKVAWRGAPMHDDVEGRESKYEGGKLM